ncbi:hypothetical protein [Desulfitibacter alkalitolerans]|jgi:hypothetical protein|uniref:hypothetical protein n=1 Tax=Desulfitibacter alkalitolerans TaxID=264641 RepID=UPI0006861C05|nr:hypothetical protein [Desulfitibacter alkalitolerans]
MQRWSFASYGFKVYTSEVDDHGIDFIAKGKNGKIHELQVKAVRQSNYVYMQKDKWNIFAPNIYLPLKSVMAGHGSVKYAIQIIQSKK